MNAWCSGDEVVLTDHDVTAAIEFPIDVYLGKGGPLRELLHAAPQPFVLQYVHSLIGSIEGIENLQVHSGVQG